MGRLFDAVSAYLEVCAYNRYEAECAIKLENLAAEALQLGLKPVKMAFDITEKSGMLIADAAPVWKALQRNKSEDKRSLALGFHRAVGSMTVELCEKLHEKKGINTVALSGGVFQNAVLLEEVIEGLEDRGFAVFTNEAVPVNDGGICLGQAYIGLLKRQKGNS
jgi:hydrogenase maturation protein HypF